MLLQKQTHVGLKRSHLTLTMGQSVLDGKQLGGGAAACVALGVSRFRCVKNLAGRSGEGDTLATGPTMLAA